MEKKLKYINELHEGDILAGEIINTSGGLVLPKNAVINRMHKSKLKLMDVRSVKVYRDSADMDDTSGRVYRFKYYNKELFKTEYCENVNNIKRIIKDLAIGKDLDIEKVNIVTESILSCTKNYQLILCCMNELRNFDEYTYRHCLNVAFYGMMIGNWLKLSKDKMKGLIQAGILHDVGKSRVPITLLNKKGRLLPEEFNEIKYHSYYGYNIVKNFNEISEDTKQAVLLHHEREDGSGYPYGVKGELICLYAKIIAIADVYDALLSDRTYRERVSPFHIFKMYKSTWLGCFDIKIILIFLDKIVKYYTGCNVLLNSGEIGEVVHIPPHEIDMPIIRVATELIDLSKVHNIEILKIV